MMEAATVTELPAPAPTPQPIPPSIVLAICQIKQSLEAVKKTSKNQHGGYMFASADDIYAALTKKMGEVGLICLGLEDACEIVRVERDGKTSQWARLTFSFVFATKDATWSDPKARRTLFIQVTGPQTFQAAQSYAEKAYLRSTFKIPTGDMDLDSMPQAETMEDQAALAGNGTKRKSSYAAKKDGKTPEVFNEIKAKISDATSAGFLQQVRNLYADEWATLPTQWSEFLDAEYETRMSSFMERA